MTRMPQVLKNVKGVDRSRVETDDALQLYAPDAVVHAGGEDLRGRRIRGWLPDSGLPGRVRSIETSGAPWRSRHSRTMRARCKARSRPVAGVWPSRVAKVAGASTPFE